VTDWLNIRSMLFMPADADRMIAGATSRGADAVILDLEDAVAPSRKDAARAALAGAVAQIGGRLPVLVRVNSDPERIVDDARASAIAGVSAIMLPKVGSAAAAIRIDGMLAASERAAGLPEGSIGLVAVIEDPAAMPFLTQIASATPRLVALGFGSEDFAAALGIQPTQAALTLPAQTTALAARARGLAAVGVPGPVGVIDNLERFRGLASSAFELGFTGVLCIHPRQVAIVNEILMPSAAEIEAAQRVVDLFDAAVARGEGAIAVDGKMIDRPVADQARRILRNAKRA